MNLLLLTRPPFPLRYRSSVSSRPLFSRYIPALDGVRAIAVTSILLYHLNSHFVPGGFMGVDFFFVLSGFLITGLLMREWSETGRIRLDLFYRRRLFRIIPPVLIMILLATALRPLILEAGQASGTTWDYWPSVMAVLLFFANFSSHLGPFDPTWSLAIEEQFYLAWPPLLIWFLLRPRRQSFLIRFASLLILLCLASRALLQYHEIVQHLAYATYARIDSLLSGCIAALISFQPAAKGWAEHLSSWRIPQTILALYFIMLLVANEKTSPVMLYGGYTLESILFAVFLFGAAQEKHRCFYLSLLSCAPAVWLGRRSYGIYVYHRPIFSALEPFRTHHSALNLVVITFLRVALTLIFAELSYRFIEQPLLRRKSSLHPKLFRHPAPPQPQAGRSGLNSVA